ncbi:MAG: hypothetical protein R3E52_10145 [Burkholderiaceae bacterium]
MNANIKTIIDFLNDRMDGEKLCLYQTASSFKRWATQFPSTATVAPKQELQELGLRVLGVCIDRVRSNIATEQTLRAFIQPGRATMIKRFCFWSRPRVPFAWRNKNGAWKASPALCWLFAQTGREHRAGLPDSTPSASCFLTFAPECAGFTPYLA